ncbi:hypothetical protein SMD11_6307 [Streptomyces albireticuli]|uniref:Uncharacterized protein n=1 Tax=Streptomyces albireticuli TaxID=1940 RepID=A0A1Z2LC46_9ACTN|nr:DUF6002 family protein [Streptomyces albireticuli]ARZ71883.1 hypothetical protein SMD11_6307 [Streptomyces albireticuli]
MGARGPSVLDNALTHYYDRVQTALHRVAESRRADARKDFSPGPLLTPPTDRFRAYVSVSGLAATEAGEHHGVRLTLLDLMRNPGTRTTKTMASLVIVARAAHHVRETGERLMLLTPSSANKATALRDAVLRAVDHGLVTRDGLRVACVVPEESAHKVWRSRLSDDPELRRRNPVLVHAGSGAAVKALAGEAAGDAAARIRHLTGVRVWHTLDLDNYRAADTVRAYFEDEYLPPRDGRVRWHSHAVSSAFGLLGHHLGTRLLAREKIGSGAARPSPGYLLVQHLATPDMVLGLHRDGGLPAYGLDRGSGLFTQAANPRFPAAADDPSESIDPTFYTKTPATAPAMSEIVRTQGGGGLVVSRHECLARYARVRALVAPAGIQLPSDPARLREWSLVMVVTGTLLAVERGLVEADEVVVHGSGSYTADDFAPLPAAALRPVGSVTDVADALHAAAAAR